MENVKTGLKKLPQDIQKIILLISKVAGQRKVKVYLVGGFVRDLLLGVKNFDLDIVVEGDGIAFAEELGDRLDAGVVRHKRFGTATVLLPDNHKIDITTCRKETYPSAASLPRVAAGELRDDMFRRDFTINAMAVSINKDDFGVLIDLFGGKVDLAQRKIRILHDASFIDDPTRILRGIRFMARYGFRFDGRTRTLLNSAVRMEMLEKVHPHRLRDELGLILKEENPVAALRCVKKYVGFKYISPRIKFSARIENLLRRSGKALRWFSAQYPDRRAPESWLVYCMGLLDTLSRAELKKLCAKFAFRAGVERRMVCFKELKPSFIVALRKRRVSAARIFHALEPLSYEVIILLKAKYGNKHLHKQIAGFFTKYHGMRLLIVGDDLLKSGVAPGPFYKQLFAKVLKAKLEGSVVTKEEELALVRRFISTR